MTLGNLLKNVTVQGRVAICEIDSYAETVKIVFYTRDFGSESLTINKESLNKKVMYMYTDPKTSVLTIEIE